MILRYNIEETIQIKDYLVKIGLFSNEIAKIKNNGQLLVNDQAVENWYVLKPGDLLEVVLPASSKGENIHSTVGDIDILYEDSYLLIINKENNIATIPTRVHFENSLSNKVMYYYKKIGIKSNIHCLGRLDFATSGLIVFCKSPYVLSLLKNTPINKDYILEVEGYLDSKENEIRTGIIKDPNSIIKRKVTFDFINSYTSYEVLEHKERTTIIKARLHTGKTHQLRLHFSYLNHPIIGDSLYGNKTEDGILHLHSASIEFKHPINNSIIKIESRPKWL